METASTLETEHNIKRVSSVPNFHSPNNSQEIANPEEFYDICKERLKISKQNTALQQKLRGSSNIPKLSFANSIEVEEQAQQKLQERRRIRALESQENLSPLIEKPNPQSTLIFHLVREKDLQIMIPDFEIFNCREVFRTIDSHESCFGLARLYCFENKFRNAFDMISQALDQKNDTIYKLWHYMISSKFSSHVERPGKLWSFSCVFCCGPKNHKKFTDLFQNFSLEFEAYWTQMVQSLKGRDSESPEHCASQIKEKNAYFGYLAWSEIYFSKNEWQKGLDILKELVKTNFNRPEAYLKLWYHYYYSVKDYEQAEGIALEALILVTGSEFHNYSLLFCVYFAKSLFKLQKTLKCVDFLQRKFLENPTYPVFFYYFGKFATKSGNYVYNGSAIGALQECLRLCDYSRYGHIYYWLAKAYMLSRQHIEAYNTIKQALYYLDPSSGKKMTELKRCFADISPRIRKIKEAEKILQGKISELNLEKLNKIIAELKDFHKLTLDVLKAKLLWKTGKNEEALKKLFAVSGVSTVKMTAHFLLIKYLEEQAELKCMKTVAYEMVMRCKNHQVPASVWVKVNLLYARTLLKNNKPKKAILVLKCIAKVLPPFPFVNVPYTKVLKKAETVEDLISAHTKIAETYNPYCYATYKNSVIHTELDVRELTQKVLSDEAAPTPLMLPVAFKSRKECRGATEQTHVIKFYRKQKTLEDVKNDNEDKKGLPKSSTLLGVPLPNLNEFLPVSICSDPCFLYKIAKIAAKHKVCKEDGVYAIKDYIELLALEKDVGKKNLMMKKALKVKKMCNFDID